MCYCNAYRVAVHRIRSPRRVGWGRSPEKRMLAIGPGVQPSYITLTITIMMHNISYLHFTNNGAAITTQAPAAAGSQGQHHGGRTGAGA